MRTSPKRDGDLDDAALEADLDSCPDACWG
jgi:hypothetical protein